MNIDKNYTSKIICPQHKTPLVVKGGKYVHEDSSACEFPIVDGKPVLINENNSIFRISSFEEQQDTTWKTNRSLLRRIIRSWTPSISHNLKSKTNFEHLRETLPAGANILIVGGSVKGSNIDSLIGDGNYNVVSLDVCLSPLVDLVGDCHDIPFESNSFDLIIIQSVLEHVLDPTRCVSEIHRVLNEEGVVYAETPFIQQVHMKAFDFTRYTHSGHRRLFRDFAEMRSGAIGGPGMALAWSYRAFVRSFSDKPGIRSVLTIFAHWTSFYLKYIDYLVVNKKASYEGASSFYFMGRKSDVPVSDEEIIDQFRGVNW